jgi:Mrp family chromosome partitioning ATPase
VGSLLSPFELAAEPSIIPRASHGPLKGLLQTTESPDLLVLLVDGEEGAGALTEAAAASIIDSARARFDFVIVNAPPVSFGDGRFWARMCDGALLVVQDGAPAETVSAALLSLGRSGARLAGTIVVNSTRGGSRKARL